MEVFDEALEAEVGEVVGEAVGAGVGGVVGEAVCTEAIGVSVVGSKISA